MEARSPDNPQLQNTHVIIIIIIIIIIYLPKVSSNNEYYFKETVGPDSEATLELL